MEQKIISRKEAIKLNLPHYFTGKPCKNNHLEKRETAYCNCLGCLREANQRRVDKDPEKSKERMKLWRQNNREHKKAENKKWEINNFEKAKQIKKEWQKNNRPTVNLKESKRRASKKSRTPMWFGEFDDFVIKEAFILAKLREKTTGIEWDVDHMIPLQAKSASGLHCAFNIQVIPSTLNRKKSNQMIFTEPGEWIKS